MYAPQDEMTWLDFEVRVRDMVLELLKPVVEVSEQDREACALLDKHTYNLGVRTQRLEQAVLNIDETGEKTLFDKMDEKMSALKIFVEQNIHKVHDRLDNKLEEIKNLTFAFDQKVNICMNAREIAENVKDS